MSWSRDLEIERPECDSIRRNFGGKVDILNAGYVRGIKDDS